MLNLERQFNRLREYIADRRPRLDSQHDLILRTLPGKTFKPIKSALQNKPTSKQVEYWRQVAK